LHDIHLFNHPKHATFCSESANEYTDDEDVSWKVRRAAAKCLAALIVSRPEILSKLYDEVAMLCVPNFSNCVYTQLNFSKLVCKVKFVICYNLVPSLVDVSFLTYLLTLMNEHLELWAI